MSILDEIVETVQQRVEKEKEDRPVEQMEIDSYEGKSLVERIRSSSEISVIGELKKTSPTSEVFRENFQPSRLAKSISGGGAVGISVLTEPSYFDGDIDYLEEVLKSVEIPVLRKDFVVDEYQLYQSAEIKSDSVLLISEILGKELPRFVELTQDLGMQPLVEVSNEDQAESAVASGAELIGVNNRDLKSMEIDLSRTERVFDNISDGVVLVSESGIDDRDDVRKVAKAGADAVLVGSAIMNSSNVREKVRRLGGFDG